MSKIHIFRFDYKLPIIHQLFLLFNIILDKSESKIIVCNHISSSLIFLAFVITNTDLLLLSLPLGITRPMYKI